ncbi:Thymidylate kinase [Sphingomonas antarctica]|uniref:dTMP kinase n=1 Tax=Sphingomonas antarctica TaxID=2040274 RepID=UPI0039EC56DD
MSQRGRFITLEGGEGVGKSTQVRRLAKALQARGIEVVTTREPGGTPGAEAIRDLLMTGAAGRWNAATETLLFAAARADHVARVIEPALAAGKWVICDRYLDSTRAYQGAAGGIDDADIVTVNRIGGAMLPDRTLLLDLPVEAGLTRAGARGASDRMGSRDDTFYDRVDAGFRAFAAAEPERFRTIDAAGSPDEVSTRLIAALSDLL